MSDRRFFAQLPSDHRSDWGAALAAALSAELGQMDRADISTSAQTGRGGSLELVINGADGHLVEISCGEDEAIVRHRGERQRFQNRASDTRRWRPDPGHNWIPDAVSTVIRIIQSWPLESDST